MSSSNNAYRDKRSTSKTFLSNDVFYGDTSVNSTERFTTQTKLVHSSRADAY